MTFIDDLETHREPFVTVQELASYWRVHENTIYRDISKGALKVCRLPGGTIRIPMTVAREYGRPDT